MVVFALTMCVLIVPAASTTFASESPSTEYYNVQYGIYHFSVDAEWLTMPHYYNTDSLGACAQNCYVMNSSREGWYSWTGTYIYDETDTISDTVNLTESDFTNATNGSWAGSAAIIQVPDPDVLYFMGFYAYTEINLHIEFYVSVSDNDEDIYFNAVATHTHHHLVIDLDSAVEIIIDDNTDDVSIGIDAWWGMEYRNATFDTPFHYIPN